MCSRCVFHFAAGAEHVGGDVLARAVAVPGLAGDDDLCWACSSGCGLAGLADSPVVLVVLVYRQGEADHG